MPLERLSHASLSARDLAKTERFYVDVLGCEVAHEFRNAAGERYGFFLHAGDGTFLEFFQKPDAPREEGLFRHLCFEVDDIEAFARHVAAHGFTDVKVTRGRTDRILQFFILDPDGTKIEFQQHDEQSALAPYTKRRENPRHVSDIANQAAKPRTAQ
jgi:catechol 2,3-dioxygenase-like lactoylglutathione lyase family enzyme